MFKRLVRRAARGLLGAGAESAGQREFQALAAEIHDLKRLAAQPLADRNRRAGPFASLRDAEFRVFSQFGEDGIIHYLIHHAEIREKSFVEFGVEDYSEANTRYLLVNENWRGLVLDGSDANIARIREDPIYWRHDLTAIAAFVDRDNINSLILNAGFSGEIGLLSVDIDGNDYWVWDRIDCVDPVVVVAEYNSIFGWKHAVTIPYDPAFRRDRAHHSYLYWGSSLGALCRLAERKGYRFVGCNSNGNNAFFVRADSIGSIPTVSPEEGFIPSRIRESRDEHGNLTFVGGAERARLIAEMPVYDVENDRMMRVAELESV